MELLDADLGLDLSSPDTWTPEEDQAYRKRYAALKGETMPGHDFWLTNGRPDVLKRYRGQAILMSSAGVESASYRKLSHLCYLHHYAIVGFEDGVRYQSRAAHQLGVQRREILAVLAVAFLQAGPLGMRFVATGTGDAFADYPDPSPSPWPPGWEPDAAAFVTGVTYKHADLTDHEMKLITAWYERECGTVPRFVTFLGKHQPRVLKAYHDRFESAAGGDIPKQLVPLLLLQWSVTCARPEAAAMYIRMAHSFGVDESYVLNCIARGMLYCGADGISALSEDLDRALEAWGVPQR